MAGFFVGVYARVQVGPIAMLVIMPRPARRPIRPVLGSMERTHPVQSPLIKAFVIRDCPDFQATAWPLFQHTHPRVPSMSPTMMSPIPSLADYTDLRLWIWTMLLRHAERAPQRGAYAMP